MNAKMWSEEHSIVDYEHKNEGDDSEYQVLWSNIMEKGTYKNPSTYQNVQVLLLCWAENCNDLQIKEEVDRLRSVLEERFNYHTQIEYLDKRIPQRLQVQVNAKVAAFVGAHDGPNTLLLVYYAGHGRPGGFYGSLELFGQTSPNDEMKRLDSIVWNKTEELLRPAEADVLEVFDCCYAGNLGLTRGEHRLVGVPHTMALLMELRLFEYLAATKEMTSTPVPGDDSFTSALIHALEALVEEKVEGRFTTVELLRKIKLDAPHFPKDQTPVLSDRERNTSAGRIMLHPLRKEGTKALTPPVEASNRDLAEQQTVTLHFDFDGRPGNAQLERLGLELNELFERNTLGVNRVRWGGMQSILSGYFRAARSFTASLHRKRRASMNQQQRAPIIVVGTSNELSAPNDLGPSTPSSSASQLSPRAHEFVAKAKIVINTPTFTPTSPPKSLESNEEEDESQDQMPDRRKRRKVALGKHV